MATIQDLLDYIKTSAKPDYGIIGDLIGAYQAYEGGNDVADAYGNGGKDYQSIADTIKTQMDRMPTLDSMYGQNSPYAQQMRLNLGAKDAAAGRNSQYGPREVQLQAALADKAANYGSMQAQWNTLYAKALSDAADARVKATVGKTKTNSQTSESLLDLANNSGLLKAGNAIVGGALGSLSGMFNPSEYPSVPINDSVYAGRSMNDYQGWSPGDTTGIPPNYGVGYDSTNHYEFNNGNVPYYDPNTYVNPDNQETYSTKDNPTDYWLDNQE